MSDLRHNTHVTDSVQPDSPSVKPSASWFPGRGRTHTEKSQAGEVEGGIQRNVARSGPIKPWVPDVGLIR
jgi:hypothetical protein